MAPYLIDVRRMAAFSAVELYALLKLRVDVFVVEQDCVYPELDGKDEEALHLRLLIDGETAAYARLWQPPDRAPPLCRDRPESHSSRRPVKPGS